MAKLGFLPMATYIQVLLSNGNSHEPGGANTGGDCTEINQARL